MKLNVVVIALLLCCSCYAALLPDGASSPPRTFVVDRSPDCNCFRKDGEPYRYVSGTMHYFQVPYGYWADRMLKMRAAGLNALQTYISWNMHEPFKGQYDFDEQNNIFQYFALASSMSLDVVLRIGPFINAERDNGGLPFWLLNINPKMRPRTSDQSFQAEVKAWWDYLLPQLVPHLYINGGNVITVQIENEYGCYSTCDKAYLKWLYDLAVSHLGADVVYFTTDTATNVTWLQCGQIDGTQTTSDFTVNNDTNEMFKNLRAVEPSGPLINSEFYPGWIVRWNDNYTHIDDDLVVEKMQDILQYDDSSCVNIYPMHGGTNFGFGAGGTVDIGFNDTYRAFIASYDFNAPITENGDITSKFMRIREVAAKYTNQPLPDVPPNITRQAPQVITLEKCGDLFGNISTLTTLDEFETTDEPQTYEQVLLNYGFALYEHILDVGDLSGRSAAPSDVAVLHAPGIHDRAIVFVDEERIDFFCRICRKHDVTLGSDIAVGQKLSLFVENQGRAAFGADTDMKGLNIGAPLTLSFTSDVSPPKILTKWNMTPIPVNETQLWAKPTAQTTPVNGTILPSNFVPTRYQGAFTVTSDAVLGHPADTFLKLNVDDSSRFWKKGVVLVNGRNIGRYWLDHSAQQTLYVPGVWLHSAPLVNYLTILETDYSPCECAASNAACKCQVALVVEPILDMKLPITTEI